MSLKIKLNLPEKLSGFWLLSNFLYCFRHADNRIWVEIEMSHVDRREVHQKKMYFFDEKINISYPLHYLMYLNLGNEFDLNGRQLKKKHYNFTFYEWSVTTEPQKLKPLMYNNDDFKGFGKYFPFTSSSDGMLYFDLNNFGNLQEEQISNKSEIKDLKSNPVQKTKIIAPASVIGQFFYFIETDFNYLLYNPQLRNIIRKYNIKNIFEEEEKKIGRFVYEWEQCKEDNTVAAISNFLFSRDEKLLNSLYGCFKKNLLNELQNPYKIPFNYHIPIASRLTLNVRGNYFKNKEGHSVFVVKEIINFDTKGISLRDLFIVDKIEYQPDIYYSSKGEVKPSDVQVSSPGFRKPKGKDSYEISGSSPASSTIKPRIVSQSTTRFGGIIDVEKTINEKLSTKVVRDIFVNGDEASEGDTLHPENGDNTDKKRGIKTTGANADNKEPKDEEKTKTYLSEVINVFTTLYKDDFIIDSFSYEPEGFPKVDFVEINKKDTEIYVYFIDAYKQRIQVLNKLDKSQYSKKTLHDAIDSINKNNLFSWIQWRRKNYTFDDMEFGISINRGVDNYVDSDFYEKEAKKFLNRINEVATTLYK